MQHSLGLICGQYYVTMSPVPEPIQDGRGGPNDGDDDGMNPPSGFLLGPPMSSSDEEADHSDANGHHPSGYQPLSQDFDEDQDDTGINYSSLSGLMAALNTHGPNVIENETEESEGNDTEGHLNAAEHEPNVSPHSHQYVHESSTQRQPEELQEQAALWNSPQIDRLSLDSNKVEEIKSVMASFTLPQSAIPPWAQDLSDEDWKHQVAGLMSKQSSLK